MRRRGGGGRGDGVGAASLAVMSAAILLAVLLGATSAVSAATDRLEQDCFCTGLWMCISRNGFPYNKCDQDGQKVICCVQRAAEAGVDLTPLGPLGALGALPHPRPRQQTRVADDIRYSTTGRPNPTNGRNLDDDARLSVSTLSPPTRDDAVDVDPGSRTSTSPSPSTAVVRGGDFTATPRPPSTSSRPPLSSVRPRSRPFALFVTPLPQQLPRQKEIEWDDGAPHADWSEEEDVDVDVVRQTAGTPRSTPSTPPTAPRAQTKKFDWINLGRPFSRQLGQQAVATPSTTPPATPLDTPLATPWSSWKDCGLKGADSGREGVAEPSEWPWHAALLETASDRYVCGTTIIGPTWLLTAAHCIVDYPEPTALKVRVGELDVRSDTESFTQERAVEQLLPHPSFDLSTLRHDVALVRTSRPPRDHRNVAAVCLPPPHQDRDEDGDEDFPREGNSCFVTGWGRKDEASPHSEVLKEVPVPIWSRKPCQDALRAQLGASFRLPATALCAGAKGRDACDGDGGGPLVCRSGERWFQVGVVSYGIGCGRHNSPGVYTRLSRYTPWIRSVTGELRALDATLAATPAASRARVDHQARPAPTTSTTTTTTPTSRAPTRSVVVLEEDTTPQDDEEVVTEDISRVVSTSTSTTQSPPRSTERSTGHSRPAVFAQWPLSAGISYFRSNSGSTSWIYPLEPAKNKTASRSGAGVGAASATASRVAKSESKAKLRPEGKTDVRPEVRFEIRPEVRSTMKPEVRQDVTPEVRFEIRPEAKQEDRFKVRSEPRPQGGSRWYSPSYSGSYRGTLGGRYPPGRLLSNVAGRTASGLNRWYSPAYSGSYRGVYHAFPREEAADVPSTSTSRPNGYKVRPPLAAPPFRWYSPLPLHDQDNRRHSSANNGTQRSSNKHRFSTSTPSTTERADLSWRYLVKTSPQGTVITLDKSNSSQASLSGEATSHYPTVSAANASWLSGQSLSERQGRTLVNFTNTFKYPSAPTAPGRAKGSTGAASSLSSSYSIYRIYPSVYNTEYRRSDRNRDSKTLANAVPTEATKTTTTLPVTVTLPVQDPAKGNIVGYSHFSSGDMAVHFNITHEETSNRTRVPTTTDESVSEAVSEPVSENGDPSEVPVVTTIAAFDLTTLRAATSEDSTPESMEVPPIATVSTTEAETSTPTSASTSTSTSTPTESTYTPSTEPTTLGREAMTTLVMEQEVAPQGRGRGLVSPAISKDVGDVSSSPRPSVASAPRLGALARRGGQHGETDTRFASHRSRPEAAEPEVHWGGRFQGSRSRSQGGRGSRRLDVQVSEAAPTSTAPTPASTRTAVSPRSRGRGRSRPTQDAATPSPAPSSTYSPRRPSGFHPGVNAVLRNKTTWPEQTVEVDAELTSRSRRPEAEHSDVISPRVRGRNRKSDFRRRGSSGPALLPVSTGAPVATSTIAQDSPDARVDEPEMIFAPIVVAPSLGQQRSFGKKSRKPKKSFTPSSEEAQLSLEAIYSSPSPIPTPNPIPRPQWTSVEILDPRDSGSGESPDDVVADVGGDLEREDIYSFLSQRTKRRRTQVNRLADPEPPTHATYAAHAARGTRRGQSVLPTNQ